MKHLTENTERLNTSGASILLSTPPVLIQENADEPVIIATLSPAGQKFMYDHGKSATVGSLVDDCIVPSDRIRATRFQWHFADPATKSGHLAGPAARPVLPDVIGHDSHPSKQVRYLYVPSTLAWFEGHFPGDPILPAVVQIDWIIHFASGSLNRSRFSGFHRLKFLAVIKPDTVLSLTTHKSNDALEFALESKANLHSKGTIHFHRGGDQR